MRSVAGWMGWVCGLMIAGSATGADFYTAASGGWRDTNTWNQPGFPADADGANIADTHGVSFTNNERCATLNLAGTLIGSNSMSIDVANFFDWPGGTYAGASEVALSSLSSHGGSFIRGDNDKYLRWCNINNWSSNAHNGGGRVYLSHNSIWSNQVGSSYLLQSDVGLMENNTSGSRWPEFRNLGTFRKTAGTGTSSNTVNFYNAGSVEILTGTLRFDSTFQQTAGSTRLNGGSLIVSGVALDLAGGLLCGTGTVSGTVNSAGVIAPGLDSTGVLNVQGNVALSTGSVLAIELGGVLTSSTMTYDQLNVSGSATLGGTLTVGLTNGFIPAIGDGVAILTRASGSGAFSQTNWALLPADRRWRVNYDADAVRVLVGGLSVSITSPTHDSFFVSPAVITVSATVTDTMGSVTQVQCWVGSSAVATSSVTASNYSLAWSNVMATNALLRVEAWDNQGLVATSAFVNITVVPAVPASISATDGAFTNNVQVTWAAVSDATGYIVYRSLTSDVSTAMALATVTATTYNDGSATAGVLYDYWVKAAGASGNSAFSAADTGFAQLLPPTGVAASDAMYYEKVRISWNPVAQSTVYQIWRATVNASGAATLLAETTGTTYDDTSSEAAQTLYYWVKARNNFALSDFSASASGRKRHSTDTRGGFASVAVYRPASGTWYILCPSNGSLMGPVNFGGPDCYPVVSDYDGDGHTDVVVYQTTTGYWHALLSGSGNTLVSVAFGGPEFMPLHGDYDGDAKADPVVYQDGVGLWYGLASASGYRLASVTLGGAGYLPLSGDYDGDGKADPAVFFGIADGRGVWNVMLSQGGYLQVMLPFGLATDTPAPADYDGDGRTDPAIYQESTGLWAILQSTFGYSMVYGYFGGPGYWPVEGDYDGDGAADVCVYQVSTGRWLALLSASGTTVSAMFGGPDYWPVGPMR